jgi:hypothetical protein
MTDSKPAPKHERKHGPRNLASSEASATHAQNASQANAALCWPFPAGSQNDTDKAVKLKPYVPPKRRTLNQY